MSGQNHTQDIKQCVLIADSFTSHFPQNPIFYDFNSTKIIQFNLNWLAHNNVKECIIVYINNQLQVEKIVADLDSKDMKITLMRCEPEQTKTMGDIMRELYFHQILSSDFLLVCGNIVSNLCLKDLWKEHLVRKQLSSKQNILTVVLRNSQAKESYVLNDASKQILQIHDFNKKFVLNHERIKLSEAIDSLTIRGNLSQAGIYACSLQVIKGFKETFQHQNINDFITGILTSELYSEKIYCYIVKNKQCIQIDQPYDYYRAYQHLLNRYLFPFIVLADRSHNHLGSRPEIKVAYLDYNKYIKANIPIRSIKISYNVYIGEESTVGAGTSLFKSIVCRNAALGAKCDIKYCLVLEGTVVPDNFKGSYSLLRGEGDSFEAISFFDQVNPKAIELETLQLFPEQVQEGQNFDQDLKIILSQTPSPDTYKQLSSLRKQYNKTCREFASAMIYNLVPESNEAVLKIVKEWGDLLKKVSVGVDDLLSGIADACGRQESQNTKFPLFLMHLYQKEILNDTDIVSWYDNNSKSQEWKFLAEKATSNFIDKLREEDEEDEEG